MEGVVRLIVKAPNQQTEDQIIRCELGWTIGRLKDHLAQVYPSKPKSSEQKLIYSGQLLSDSAFLRDVLHHYGGGDQLDQSYTVHLVCAPTMPFYTDKARTNTSTNGQDGNMGVLQPDAVLNPVQSERLQSQSLESEEVNNPGSSSAQLYSTQRYYNQLNSQQIAWMQQAYTHYLTQYMQMMAAQGIQVQSSIPYIQPVNTNTNEAVNNNNRDDHQRAAAHGAGAPIDPAEANNANNNAAAADERGDGGIVLNRDWLDFFYMLSRVIVLFSIVYFYSSPLRFLIVTFLGFAVYLYQGGFFRVQPMLLVDNNNGRVDNNNQILQNEAVGAQALPAQQPPPAPQTDTHVNPNDEDEGQRPGALAFAWTFFSSFFASLIPDQPNVV
ncbi:homocysteine-responsive endoplasmic reticulum-resident ubiquitin-like domain member 2 protein isoform X1 [Diprion similis]|uniref:homocysteine-responsive endoplasmic reticulum-resident ubiquitin-like domain member 2 protein isoform X1 n=1 Tax=Diprion similis TaxID=362088 RepID=UPI001EF8FCC8|nr:homocysteine-responsive endoplasmic reticulum-resident ubiquitin-like domain member 2 protein isoform X1 [Diprion similis]